MIRRVAQRLTPLVERGLARFDSAWSARDHLALAARLRPVAEAASRLEGPAPVASELLACWPRGDAPLAPTMRDALRALLGNPDPAGLRAAARELAGALEPRRWFSAQGVTPGLADLLRSLLLGQPNDPLTRDLCERALRHAEVQRSLAFASPSSSAGEEALAERLAWCHVLLDAGGAYSDLRFLNAAMKQLDGIALAARRTRAANVAAAYVEAVDRQEQALVELQR